MSIIIFRVDVIGLNNEKHSLFFWKIPFKKTKYQTYVYLWKMYYAEKVK